MIWWLAPLFIGLNLSLWSLFGLMRLADEAFRRWFRAAHLASSPPRARKAGSSAGSRTPKRRRMRIEDVAVLMAAHNEEVVITASLSRLAGMAPRANMYVVSDGSTDNTVGLARECGANVVETPTNVGKAGALAYAIDKFSLLSRYRAVMVLDADTQLDPRYFKVALPLLNDPQVVAVAGCAHTRWQKRLRFVGNVIVAHRSRIYAITQLLVKYGQTWRGVSATHIVPGFASIYRTEVLKHIDINPPGLVIEDFNMTFELHAKQLGRIAFHPGARAYTQDPDRYRDYVNQTRRWALGLWQTVRRHRPKRSLFAASLSLTLLELLTSSVMFLLLVPTIILLALVDLAPGFTSVPVVGVIGEVVAAHLSFRDLGLGIFLPDYLLTCLVALWERRPRYLLAGLLFIPMKITDAVVTLSSLPHAWLDRSTGRWISPTRRPEQAVQGMKVA